MDPPPPILGIPRELRLGIYEAIMLMDLEYDVVENYIHMRHLDSFEILHRHRNSKLVIPWVQLIQTCKQINAELSDYMSSVAISNKPDYRTYVLDIFAHDRFVGRLSKATWRHIPCPPAGIKNIEVNFGFERHDGTRANRPPKFWGDGGPMPIVRELYQTMNLLLHNGPILDRTEPLPRHLSFESLIVNIRRPEPQGTSHKFLRSTFHLSNFMRSMQRTGLLYTYINRFRLVAGDEQEEFEISAVENPRVPAHWAGYGFEWGLPSPATNEVETESHVEST
ncbi:hypothetical protein GGR57DRAFT_470197 [Xylariaceae sp. FL1272]|nr:hypothetical protein GGR57DRAFT_470197 [Xylariaceae sp. FL1272]